MVFPGLRSQAAGENQPALYQPSPALEGQGGLDKKSRAGLQVISGGYHHRPLPRAVLSLQSKLDPSQPCREKLPISPVTVHMALISRDPCGHQRTLLRRETASPALAASHCSPLPVATRHHQPLPAYKPLPATGIA